MVVSLSTPETHALILNKLNNLLKDEEDESSCSLTLDDAFVPVENITFELGASKTDIQQQQQKKLSNSWNLDVFSNSLTGIGGEKKQNSNANLEKVFSNSYHFDGRSAQKRASTIRRAQAPQSQRRPCPASPKMRRPRSKRVQQPANDYANTSVGNLEKRKKGKGGGVRRTKSEEMHRQRGGMRQSKLESEDGVEIERPRRVNRSKSGNIQKQDQKRGVGRSKSGDCAHLKKKEDRCSKGIVGKLGREPVRCSKRVIGSKSGDCALIQVEKRQSRGVGRSKSGDCDKLLRQEHDQFLRGVGRSKTVAENNRTKMAVSRLSNGLINQETVAVITNNIPQKISDHNESSETKMAIQKLARKLTT